MKRNGYTLIEILVVIGVLGLIISFGMRGCHGTALSVPGIHYTVREIDGHQYIDSGRGGMTHSASCPCGGK